MGLKDLLFGGAEGKLKRHVARAKNKDAQSADRFASLEALKEDGSPEAVLGLLGRFTIRYDKSIEDEQEKEFVFEALKGLGARILPQLQQHLRSAEHINWGLKVLQMVADPDARWPVLADLCERNDNTYTRDPSKKIQLLHFLGEEDDPRCARALLPYLEDMDEGVRYAATEGLLRHKDEGLARGPLLQLLVNPKEESRRTKTRVLEGLAELGWEVAPHEAEVERLLSEFIPGAGLEKGRVRRK